MSPNQVETVQASAVEALTTSRAICGLFDMLVSGRPDGALFVDGRTASGIDAGRPMWVRPGDIDREFIPSVLVGILEAGGWSLHAAAAVRAGVGSLDVSRLGVALVSWRLRPAFDGHHWVVPTEVVTSAYARLREFPLPPTSVIFGGTPTAGAGYMIAALFALDPPLDVTAAPEQASVLDLLRRLAHVIGSDAPADGLALRDLSVPVPGTVIRQGQGLETARCLLLQPGRRYTREQLEAAIRGDGARATASAPTTPISTEAPRPRGRGHRLETP